MLNRYNFASSSFEFSTFLSSRNSKKIACSPHFHLLHLSGVILQDYQEIYREEAVGVKSYNYTLKISIF